MVLIVSSCGQVSWASIFMACLVTSGSPELRFDLLGPGFQRWFRTWAHQLVGIAIICFRKSKADCGNSAVGQAADGRLAVYFKNSRTLPSSSVWLMVWRLMIMVFFGLDGDGNVIARLNTVKIKPCRLDD